MELLLALIVVFVIGTVAGFIGTIVGGSGLLSIPALIFLGLPPQMAIATNKFGSLGITTAGFYQFNKAGKVDYRIGVPIAIISTVGAYIGANTLLTIPNAILEKLIGVFILIILTIVLLNRDIGVKKSKQNSQLLKYAGYLSFLFIGFWAGFFGGGYAIFASYALIFMFGQTFLESSGTRKILGVCIAIIAIIVFSLNGVINWTYGAALILGTGIGSYVGAAYGIKKGDRWVRGLFTIVVLASAIKLLL